MPLIMDQKTQCSRDVSFPHIYRVSVISTQIPARFLGRYSQVYSKMYVEKGNILRLFFFLKEG